MNRYLLFLIQRSIAKLRTLFFQQMFSLIRRLTALDGDLNEDGTQWNVFEKNQGSAEWPDLPAYTAAPSFSVSVRTIIVIRATRDLESVLLTPVLVYSQCDQETCGYTVASGAAEGLAA
jgi:hypothetical protein